MNLFRRILICLFSAGWLIPLWLGVSTYLGFWQSEVLPILLGNPQMNSFPFIQFSKDCFTVSSVWLGLAIIFWSWKLSKTS